MIIWANLTHWSRFFGLSNRLLCKLSCVWQSIIFFIDVFGSSIAASLIISDPVTSALQISVEVIFSVSLFIWITTWSVSLVFDCQTFLHTSRITNFSLLEYFSFLPEPTLFPPDAINFLKSDKRYDNKYIKHLKQGLMIL